MCPLLTVTPLCTLIVLPVTSIVLPVLENVEPEIVKPALTMLEAAREEDEKRGAEDDAGAEDDRTARLG